MEYPTTMLDFMHQLPDDDACRTYLEKMRWPNGFVCSRCQGTNVVSDLRTASSLRKS
jgi:hypothetical protein